MKESSLTKFFRTPYLIIVLKKFYNLYAHKHKTQIFTLFLGAIFAGILEILGIIGLYYMIRVLIKMDSLGENHIVLQTLNNFNFKTHGERIAFFGFFIAAIFIAKNIYIMTYYFYQHHTLRIWKSEISSDFMRRYLYAPYRFLLGYNSSTIVRNINNIVTSALNGFILAAFNYLANIITGLIILSLIYLKYFKVSILVASILITATVIQNLFLKKKAIALGIERDKLMEEQNKNVYQGIHAMKETKVMGKENFFMKAFNSLNFKTVNNDSKNMLLARLPAHITEIVIIISIVVICVAVLSDESNTSDASVASLGALAAIAFRIAPIMNRILGNLQSMNKNLGSIETMFEELRKLDEISEELPIEQRKTIEFQNSIKFENVTYSYPSTKIKAVENISFEIPKGKFIGIVGESGAGKSTMMDMLLGLLSPTEGKILIDGADLDKYTKRSWQDKLAFVPQNIYLSDDTLKKNIAFGIEDEDIDENKVREVLEIVQLSELVNTKKKGLNFIIGENGKRLSGGQKQRLAIARALYFDEDVILLDEATSALDLNTEYEISKFLHENVKNKTIVAIAHRLSTVYDADKIIFMDKGKIVDQGTFVELQTRNTEFEKLARLARISNQ